ncbi:MAG TPA: sugar transferase [Kofleriaceae bacterium]|nr:sugar transferase [Kofleriaceae bacterium]
MKQTGWRLAAKRALDRTLGAAGLALAAPVLAATAVAIRATMGAPVLFTQPRTGHGGRTFEVWKFRTMRDATGPDGQPLPDGERITRLGAFLRSTSLDELPQLVNVLRGELSLVGPRPLLPRYLPRYTPEQRRRHDVLPGITGWAQINGRNAIDWPTKLRLDVWYVDHWSLLLDLQILGLTAIRVLQRTGVARSATETMPEFRGES